MATKKSLRYLTQSQKMGSEVQDERPTTQLKRSKCEIKRPVRYGYDEYADATPVTVTDTDLKAADYREPKTLHG